MKLIIVLLCVTSIYAQDFNFTGYKTLWTNNKPPPPVNKNAKAAPPLWGTFTQKLDNFNNFDFRSFQVRYLGNNQFFQPGGPIFLMIGGEGEISPGYLQGGNMFDMAMQNNAVMFYLEHRYYGKSIPFSTLTTGNLKYLSARQALVDIARFITALKQVSYFVNSKVVCFGGSYAGNLAIWMRYSFPTLVHAAVSSSAPVQAQVDFKEYFEIVQTALNNVKCTNVIKNGIAQINKYLSSGLAGVSKVKTDFNTCYPVNVNNFNDKANFYTNIAYLFAGRVQYASGNDLVDTCSQLMDMSLPSDYDRLVKYVRKNSNTCLPNYSQIINYYSSPYSTDGGRQWFYQTCTEFGYFQTSASINEPFYNYFPVNVNYQMCNDLFGYGYGASSAASGVIQTNNYFKGLNIQVTRVISVQGSYDPWSALGLKISPNVDAPVIVVPGTSHCQDMYSIQPADSVALKNAKLKEQECVKKWLSQK